MKYLSIVILFFAFGWISCAQTNVATNGVDALLALVTTNPPAPAPMGFMPAHGPIIIDSAGRAVFDINGHWVTYTDDVRVTNGEWTLTCDWLKLNLPQNGEDPTNITAETNVVTDFLDKSGQKIRGIGDKAVYFYNVQNGVTNKTVTLTGNPPKVRMGLSYFTGDTIVYDLMSGVVYAPSGFRGYYENTNSPAGKTNQPAKPKSL
jgi:lipopolysaccharide transport protein LptA